MELILNSPIILVIIGSIICLIASIRVNSTFNKYNKVKSRTGLTANEAAERILRDAGITDVRIERIKGNLTDHYSPKEKVLRLSDATYNNTSVAAIGVAAHECGHAIQHQFGFGPLKLRSFSVPIANFGSWISIPILILGIIMSIKPLVTAGIVLFSFVVLFQIITLPVEFNASSRALKILESNHMLDEEEHKGASKVLRSAALTYVAAALSAVLSLLRLIIIARRN